FDREIGMSHRHRGKPDKARWLVGTYLGELLVLNLDDLCLQVAFGLVPEIRVDAERLDVDPLLVHRLDPLGADDECRDCFLVSGERGGLRDVAMGMHVDGAHPLPLTMTSRRRPTCPKACRIWQLVNATPAVTAANRESRPLRVACICVAPG